MESCQLAQTGSLTFIRLNLRKINPVFVTSNAAFFFYLLDYFIVKFQGAVRLILKKEKKVVKQIILFNLLMGMISISDFVDLITTFQI